MDLQLTTLFLLNENFRASDAQYFTQSGKSSSWHKSQRELICRLMSPLSLSRTTFIAEISGAKTLLK
jgi:hypothetical protein